MPQYTDHLGLTLPMLTDPYDINDANGNFEKLDDFAASMDRMMEKLQFTVQALQEQLNIGFVGTSIIWRFTDEELPHWKGYEGSGLPEGIVNAAEDRLYFQEVK